MNPITYVRWVNDEPTSGYEEWSTLTETWQPATREYIRGLQSNKVVVHYNPGNIPRAEA